MRGAALRRRRRVVDGRTNERVAKVDVAVGERDEPGVLPGLEGVVLEAERVEGRPDRLHLVRQRNRRDNERPPRVLRKPLRTPGEGPLERRPGRHRIGQSLPSCELLGGEDAAELDERERVPLGGLAQPPRHIGCDGPSLVAGQDECGVLRAERRQLQLLQRRRVERALAALPARRAGSRRSRRRGASPRRAAHRRSRDRSSGRRPRGSGAGWPPRPRRSGSASPRRS